LQNLNHFFAAGFREVIGKEAAIAYDQTHCHLGSRHGVSTLQEQTSLWLREAGRSDEF
jgi:hypothetical protein